MPRENRDSIGHTLKVAVLLCLGCSLLVSLSAVGLRSMQQANREAFRKQNILIAAGLYDEATDVDEVFADRVETEIIELETGKPAGEGIDPDTFDALKEARDPEVGSVLSTDVDIAGIKRLEKHAAVYRITQDGRLDQVVLPIRGYGLWSTLYGFISLDAQSLREGPDHLVVRGLTFYKHAETPGLGGEVDNPAWKAQWEGKHPYDADWTPALEVVKSAEGEREVDALSGATITSQGVSNMMKFWFGANGFAPYLKRLHEELNDGIALKNPSRRFRRFSVGRRPQAVGLGNRG